jgi:hypothetical protein
LSFFHESFVLRAKPLRNYPLLEKEWGDSPVEPPLRKEVR